MLHIFGKLRQPLPLLQALFASTRPVDSSEAPQLPHASEHTPAGVGKSEAASAPARTVFFSDATDNQFETDRKRIAAFLPLSHLIAQANPETGVSEDPSHTVAAKVNRVR